MALDGRGKAFMIATERADGSDDGFCEHFRTEICINSIYTPDGTRAWHSRCNGRRLSNSSLPNYC